MPAEQEGSHAVSGNLMICLANSAVPRKQEEGTASLGLTWTPKQTLVGQPKALGVLVRSNHVFLKFWSTQGHRF